MIQDIRYWASRSYITVTMVRKPGGEPPSFFINKNGVAPQIRHVWGEIWKDINKNNRVVEALSTVFYDHMLKMMVKRNSEQLSIEFHIGYIYFAEHCLKWNDSDFFELDMTETISLISPFNTLKKFSRRLGKSTIDKIRALRDIICFSDTRGAIIERNWNVCKKWMEVRGPYTYLRRSPFLYGWAGGKPITKLKTQLILPNGSGLVPCPVKGIEDHLVGEGLDFVVEDEKSRHPRILDALGNSKPSGLSTLLQGQKRRKHSSPIVHNISSTPDGIGTEFYNDEQNPNYLRLFAPIGCPKGYKRWVCNQRLDGELCPHFSLTLFEEGKSEDKTLHCFAPIKYLPPDDDGIEYPDFTGWFFRLPDDRTIEGDVVEMCRNEFYNLGKELWLQEYMGENIDFTGNAFDRDMINKFMDNTVEDEHESQIKEYGHIHHSSKTCVAAMDLGRTKTHQTVLIIAEEYKPKIWHIIRVVYLQDWLRENYGIKIHHAHYLGDDEYPGIFDYVLRILKGEWGNYNIKAMVGDATGPGGDFINTFNDMLLKHMDVETIQFKIESQSEKFGGGKMAIARSLMANMQNGKIKSIYDDKLRMEALAWKIEESRTGRLIGHAPQRGSVRSDDGIITAMLINWLAFNKAITDDFIPDVEMSPSYIGKGYSARHGNYEDDGDIFARQDEAPRRWYEE